MTLLDQARAWLVQDPDPVTSAELAGLIEAAEHGRTEELAERFAGELEFGTAGLRGALGAGPMRMNRVVVMRAAAGLAAYLNARGGGAVVIGYDARHNSDVFARDTAAVISGAGLMAMVLPSRLPTPVLAFAITHLGAAAGVMVTASHNPPQDNGYKVYLGDGSQIVPPADSDISAAIAQVGRVDQLPLGQDWETLGEEVLSAYLHRAQAIADPGAHPPIRVAYTPMHGVGGNVLLKAFEQAGFPVPHVVPAQFEPDPDFPTVAFPNPEEPGAMDLLLGVARATSCDLAIANDPDADRCAIAVGTGDTWRALRGDELGVALGWWLGERARRSGADLTGTFACSIVSSSMLARIAASFGLDFVTTLTGFKWIGRLPGLQFGYEEALGYCVDPTAVKDKDGISAALVATELATAMHAEGRTILEVLDDLYRQHGVYLTEQISVRVSDLSRITAILSGLRAKPPQSLGGAVVESIEDLSLGTAGLPPTDGLRYWLAGGGRVIVRPSGTEPKLKCYLEIIEPVDTDLVLAKSQAATRIAGVRTDLAALLDQI